MGKTPPKEKEAEGSPRKKAPRVDDAAPTTVPGASAPSPAGKTPPKGEEAEGSPRKKAPRLDDAALPTAPGTSEPNPTGESPPKEEAEGSPPKRSRSPRHKSPRRLAKWPAAAVPLATVPEKSELIVEAAAGASDEKWCKCNHDITDSAIEELIPSLLFGDAWACCDCRREDEKGILKTRPMKSDLLICVAKNCSQSRQLCCGVGSVAYPFGHSRAHALKEKHWFAVLYCDPERRGYCFKCNAEVPMPVKFGENDKGTGLEVIRDFVRQLPPQPSFGQTEAGVNPTNVEMTGKVQAESRPSGFAVDLADQWPIYESRSSDAQGYAIRGIPNLGNTCYMNAVLQCLLALGKLRERLLALDRPKGLLPVALKELFVETNAAGDVLDPLRLLNCIGWWKADSFQIGQMEDSHELLMALRNIWNESEAAFNGQSGAPTLIDSIFRFEMLKTLSCKKCGHSSPTPDVYWDLTVKFPSEWHPTQSAASPQTSESPRSRKEIAVQQVPAYVQRNLEKMQTVSESGCSRVIGSEVIVDETHKPLEVDSTQAQCSSQSKDVVQSPLQIQEGKSVDSLIEDSISIEDLLLFLFSESQVEWSCNCPKDHKEPSASQSKKGQQIVGSGNENDVGDPVEIHRITMLPPVLTLHLVRTSKETPMPEPDKTVGCKISVHVRFKEHLDVEQFMDPSSVDKGSTVYRLAGVVEHIGNQSLKLGHYIAYVRGARRLGNQQEGSSCSSSWFCADDSQIRQVTFNKVLSSEAYILFYERMED